MPTIYRDSINKMYESIIWTHKIHRTYLESLSIKRKIISIIELTLSSLTSVATAISALSENKILSVVFAVATFLSVVLGQVLEKIETKSNIEKFKKSSEKLWDLKCEIIKLSDEIKASKLTDNEINTKLTYFQQIFSCITSNLDVVPNYIVKRASKKIKIRKDEEAEEELL